MKRKRKVGLGLLALLIFFVSMPAFADVPTIRAEVDEKMVDIPVVQMTMDGEAIASDVPPVLLQHQEQYRTLVPVAVIAEKTGATVSWDGEKRQVRIETEEKEINLTIDSANVEVNGEKKILPSQVPAKIVTYQERGRTMVPVAFVGQELGLDVGWDEENRRVVITSPEKEETEETEETSEPEDTSEVEESTLRPDEEEKTYEESLLEEAPIGDEVLLKDISIKIVEGMPEIRLKTGEEVTFNTAQLMNPQRLVFDLNHTRLSMDGSDAVQEDKTVKVTAPSNAYISGVRSSQFERTPWVTRLVLDMKNEIGHDVRYDEDTGEMVIRLIHYVEDVRFERYNAKEVVVIAGSNAHQYNLMKLDSPHRLVIDTMDSVLNPGHHFPDFNVGGRVADRVRVSEFTPDHHYDPDDKIVRTVIDLNKVPDMDDLYFDKQNGRLVVHLEGKPDEGYRYVETGWTSAHLTFFGDKAVDYELEVDESAGIVKLIMPKDNMDIPFELLDVDDPLIEYIQITENTDGDKLIANVHVKPGVEIRSPGIKSTRNLSLEFTNRDLRYRERLIVIDPGHGGKDPGATSPTLGMTEKEVVLEVALEAEKLLQEAGFRTYMIRRDDTFVSLQDRASISNQMNAHLFVSVHANAAPRSDIKGVETLYYPSENSPTDFRDNLRLAEIFQEEMVRTLNASSHRINARDRLYVLRETNMPAIITEIGFLTNPEEEKLLATTQYRKRAAEGIRNAVIRYVEETGTHLSEIR
ncbi:N-acetylmuramoyl-L-alanine amidase [Tindallia californiensis]|uniref:N-acetylmuramoyl-L-alanine amidase n=1 Tax=Tindallia californiensis TaxID=159292 RepID=A0A1H3KIX1_9FIRM|nr:N-acetylmuramoyl-L-alanine amidase [Tindallia californiensis]SDY51588.1 N-acetylmuramoyl-L-alanine amidase [Tindallia californiensis]